MGEGRVMDVFRLVMLATDKDEVVLSCIGK